VTTADVLSRYYQFVQADQRFRLHPLLDATGGLGLARVSHGRAALAENAAEQIRRDELLHELLGVGERARDPVGGATRNAGTPRPSPARSEADGIVDELKSVLGRVEPTGQLNP
jgi:hypothetical protein